MADEPKNNENENAIDAEFEETVFNNQVGNDAEDDDQDIIIGEIARPKEKVVVERSALLDEKKPEEKSDIDKFFDSLDTATTDAKIIIKRLANLNYTFRCPGQPGLVETIVWSQESPDEISAYVQKKHGGSRYSFQMRYGGSLKKYWEETISDPIELSERELLLQREKTKAGEQRGSTETSRSSEKTAPPKSAFAELKERLEEAQQLKTLLVPEAPATIAPAPALPVDDQIKLQVFKMAETDPTLKAIVGKHVANLFAPPEESNWLTDIIKYGGQHPEELMNVLNVGKQFLGGLVGALLPANFGGVAPAGAPGGSLPGIPGGIPARQQPQSPATGLQAFRREPEATAEQPSPETSSAAAETAADDLESVTWDD